MRILISWLLSSFIVSTFLMFSFLENVFAEKINGEADYAAVAARTEAGLKALDAKNGGVNPSANNSPVDPTTNGTSYGDASNSPLGTPDGNKVGDKVDTSRDLDHVKAVNAGDLDGAVAAGKGGSTDLENTTDGNTTNTSGKSDEAVNKHSTTNTAGDKTSEGGGDSGGATMVTVTEAIPGMDCAPDGGSGPTSKKFKCTIQPGFGSVMLILKGLIKYATFITALIGVLMLVVSGVQYSIAGADKTAADDAKKRIEKVLAGIILLFLVGFILNSVAPWVYR